MRLCVFVFFNEIINKQRLDYFVVTMLYFIRYSDIMVCIKKRPALTIQKKPSNNAYYFL
ncbi:Uncharacterized protein EbC_pEb17200910 (plasmid) [Erwinia billingiae Eb661]|uniref:Uncharacterized protein n=1 Tax=Erwinia billingiae (strain Eb661) TaxID=634500 RepID=D8MJU6_ERWBE|nr:Uncharacterized protein EbC_pEb17200910 [Erwinia billingiae Eb661]